MMLSNLLVGQPIERVEDLRLLAGRGTYVGDIAPSQVLSAVVYRSPYAHGRIRRIDASAALATPGVMAVYTARDIGNVPLIPLRQQVVPEGEPFRQPVMAHEKVRYVGEPVALVIATDQAIAEDALEHIALEVDPLPVIADAETAFRGATLLFDDAGTNHPMTFEARMGDADAAFVLADYTRREQFSVQRHTALPMETRGLVAEWDDEAGRLRVSGAAKVPFFNRRILAGMLGLPEHAVDMLEVDVGGGFGARGEFYPEDFLIPFAAFQLRGSVRWVEDRREHMMAMNHAREMAADVEIACRKNGEVLAIRGRIDVDVGAYVRTNGFTAPRNVAQFLTGPYYIPNIALDAPVFVTNKTPAGTYRGPGRFESSFFCERLLDLAANDLGIGRDEIRLRNLISEEQMPYKLAQMGHIDPSSETECDGGIYSETLSRCLAEFGWSEKQCLSGQNIDGRWHGIGLGCFIEGGAAGPREGCRMALEVDGSVTVSVGSSAIGQGLETILSQIAADALGLPIQRVRLLHGSTNLVSEGFGSFHSRSTVMGGSAVFLTAESLLDEMRKWAAQHFGCNPAEVHLDGSVANHKGQETDVASMARATITAERSFTNTKHTYSYGAHAAHVAVDATTGHVEVIDYVTVEDVGRIINPATLHGQVLGAVVQGLGSVFLEEIHYDDQGQLLTGSLADYLLPTASDFPRIRSISLALRPCANNPLGAKGAGEGGLIAVGGAIANAIADALQSFAVKPNHLPLSPARVWRLIQNADAHR